MTAEIPKTVQISNLTQELNGLRMKMRLTQASIADKEAELRKLRARFQVGDHIEWTHRITQKTLRGIVKYLEGDADYEPYYRVDLDKRDGAQGHREYVLYSWELGSSKLTSSPT